MTDTAAARIVQLHHDGLTREQIVVQLGVAPDYVLRIQRRAGMARVANRTKGSMEGNTLGDPKRADKLLRRFSWEAR